VYEWKKPDLGHFVDLCPIYIPRSEDMRERLRKLVPLRLPYLTWGFIPLRNLMAWDCCESVTQELCAIYVGLLF
jgi:hypothetical protein